MNPRALEYAVEVIDRFRRPVTPREVKNRVGQWAKALCTSTIINMTPEEYG